MSGVFGIIRLPGAVVADVELTPMAETLKHRGPDGINYFARGNAGLGHCMLQSTPESLHEVLPFRDEAAGMTITADARIDNREQLFADIPVRATGGQVITDSQLILHAYLKWGEACVDHLLGDFVFAIWDERSQSLFVARDHMGCKPFYYHCRDGLFVFASSAMAVARVPEVKATLNEGRVADYLVQELEGINKTCSWYNEISRMPPAQCGYFRNNHFQYRQYWTLEPTDLSHLKTDEDYLQAFTEVYTEAVRCRLRCQTEPASMLSGGLDSSTIVALARDIQASKGHASLRTYSGISETGEISGETRSVLAVISQGKLRSNCLQPPDLDVYATDLNNGFSLLEDPFDGSWVLLSMMFMKAAQDGVRILLSGLDGDHAVGAPTNYLTYLLRQGHWRSAWYEACGLSRHYWRGEYSAARLYALGIRSCLVPARLRALKMKLYAPLRARWLSAEFNISAEFSSNVDLSGRVKEYDRSRMLKRQVSMAVWHQHIMQVPYLTAAVERYERLGSYFGVEARHPLLDIRLLELSCALPWQQKVRDGWFKFIMRHLASRRLCGAVAWREDWDQLGWYFVSRWAQLALKAPGNSLEQMEQVVAPYVTESLLASRECSGVRMEEGTAVEMWSHRTLYQWLCKASLSVPA